MGLSATVVGRPIVANRSARSETSAAISAKDSARKIPAARTGSIGWISWGTRFWKTGDTIVCEGQIVDNVIARERSTCTTVLLKLLDASSNLVPGDGSIADMTIAETDNTGVDVPVDTVAWFHDKTIGWGKFIVKSSTRYISICDQVPSKGYY